MPPTARKPQDHKAKAPKGFTFDAAGSTYSIPAPSEALGTISGRALRNAMMDGEQGQVAFTFVCLEASGIDEAALDALYSLPAPAMLEIAGRWMASADLSGATLPQS